MDHWSEFKSFDASSLSPSGIQPRHDSFETLSLGSLRSSITRRSIERAIISTRYTAPNRKRVATVRHPKSTPGLSRTAPSSLKQSSSDALSQSKIFDTPKSSEDDVEHRDPYLGSRSRKFSHPIPPSQLRGRRAGHKRVRTGRGSFQRERSSSSLERRRAVLSKLPSITALSGEFSKLRIGWQLGHVTSK
jgi:hypothetical protein